MNTWDKEVTKLSDVLKAESKPLTEYLKRLKSKTIVNTSAISTIIRDLEYKKTTISAAELEIYKAQTALEDRVVHPISCGGYHITMRNRVATLINLADYFSLQETREIKKLVNNILLAAEACADDLKNTYIDGFRGEIKGTQQTLNSIFELGLKQFRELRYEIDDNINTLRLASLDSVVGPTATTSPKCTFFADKGMQPTSEAGSNPSVQRLRF